MEGVAGIKSPPADGSFPGAGQGPLPPLPSGGKRPPPSEGSKGGEVPQLHRPLFCPIWRRQLALHETVGCAIFRESRFI